MSKLIRILILSACFSVGLWACGDTKHNTENTKGLKQNTQYQLKIDCAPLVKIFDSCPVSRLPKQSQEHMMNVLEEQMRVLPASEAMKKCQELQGFWKVACGVAGAQ